MFLINFFLKILIYLVALIIVLLMRIVSFFFLIRFIKVNSHRLGHFAANLELYFTEMELGLTKPKKYYLDFAFCDDLYPTCNEFLFTLWKREITFLPSWLCYRIIRINSVLDNIIDSNNQHVVSSYQSDRDVFNTLDHTNPKIQLKNEEIKYGDKILFDKYGIKTNDKIICLIVRDNKYLKNFNSQDFSYHDYRHTDINKFEKSIKNLIEHDYYIFRMGVTANKRLEIKHPKFIDYAFSDQRSDFMDVYLANRCTFCISTSTGFDALPLIFRKHIAFITVPVGLIFSFSDKFISITKNHYSKKLKRMLTLNEIFQLDISLLKKKEQYEINDVELIENTEDEINDLVKEMHLLINNRYEVDYIGKKMQREFWQIYKKNISLNENLEKLHGKIKSKISFNFLKNNEHLIQ